MATTGRQMDSITTILQGTQRVCVWWGGGSRAQRERECVCIYVCVCACVCVWWGEGSSSTAQLSCQGQVRGPLMGNETTHRTHRSPTPEPS